MIALRSTQLDKSFRRCSGKGERVVSTSVASRPTSPLYTTSWRAMGSTVELLIAHAPAVASLAAEAVRADFATIEAHLTRFQPESELCQLNRSLGRWVSVSPLLYTVLSRSHRAWRITGGLFDPTLLPDLERLGYHGAASWSPPQTLAGPWVERRPRVRQVRLSRPVDLGGIGKSWAVFQGGRRLLESLGPKARWLLNAGGDLWAYGDGPESDGWRIGIEHPIHPQRLIAVARLPQGGAVATSSTARRRWLHQGQTVHHLLDPRSRQPGGQGLLSVTVAHRHPVWAEVWAKTLFLWGATAIAGRAARLGLPTWWVTEAGTLHANTAAWQLTIWREEPQR